MPVPPKQEPVAVVAPPVALPVPTPALPVVDTVVDRPLNGVLAALSRTPCFGSCPVFEAQVWMDGTATWKGEKNVARLGLYRAQVPEQWLEDLLAYAEKNKYFELSAQYPLSGREIPDLPLTVCFLKKGTLEKKVRDGGDAPVALLQLERYFAEKLETLVWEKINK